MMMNAKIKYVCMVCMLLLYEQKFFLFLLVVVTDVNSTKKLHTDEHSFMYLLCHITNILTYYPFKITYMKNYFY